MRQTILLTGGSGYIGSHTAIELLLAGSKIVIYDNFSNSDPSVIDRIKQITGNSPELIKGDIRDSAHLENVLTKYAIDSVVHFAGLKAVGESNSQPLKYYDQNVGGTVALLCAMDNANVKSLVFSSSATVYGNPNYLPLDENHPRSATNPYGRTKLHIEQILEDLSASDPSWKIISLRYFNPVGAHDSGLIGEDPNDIPNNLMPFISQVAVGRRELLEVFGNDYDTQDGTGVRDYIHVVDLAKGHLAALDKLDEIDSIMFVNLGTGQGTSVLEMIGHYKRASNREIPFRIAPRRAGDVASCYASAKKAEEFLNWKAELDIETMCQSSWKYQSKGT